MCVVYERVTTNCVVIISERRYLTLRRVRLQMLPKSTAEKPCTCTAECLKIDNFRRRKELLMTRFRTGIIYRGYQLDNSVNAARRFFDGWRSVQKSAIPYRIAARKAEAAHALTGANFNIFQALWPNEIRISSFIGHLLNPKESHGQGVKYLQLFLAMLDNHELSMLNPEELAMTTVALEYITKEGRRIDLLIDIQCNSNRVIIGIENKPTALEAKDQLKDYQNELKKFQNAAHYMIFLSGRGEDSKSADHAHEIKVQQWSYKIHPSKPSLQNWIKMCVASTSAHSVWSALTAFEEYITKEFTLATNPT